MLCFKVVSYILIIYYRVDSFLLFRAFIVISIDCYYSDNRRSGPRASINNMRLVDLAT